MHSKAGRSVDTALSFGDSQSHLRSAPAAPDEAVIPLTSSGPRPGNRHLTKDKRRSLVGVDDARFPSGGRAFAFLLWHAARKRCALLDTLLRQDASASAAVDHGLPCPDLGTISHPTGTSSRTSKGLVRALPTEGDG